MTKVSLFVLMLTPALMEGQRPLSPIVQPASHAAAPQQSSDAVKPGLVGASPASLPDYKIGPGDVLQLTVWKEQQLSGAFPVRPDGMISLVLVGEVKAAGKSPAELSIELTEQLKKYIQSPLVTVTVTAVNSQKVFVLGEVQRVGPIEMSANMTALQAISAAGGLSPYANAKNVYILRNVSGKQQKIPFNYKKALSGDLNSAPTLVTGDTIVVP